MRRRHARANTCSNLGSYSSTDSRTNTRANSRANNSRADGKPNTVGESNIITDGNRVHLSLQHEQRWVELQLRPCALRLMRVHAVSPSTFQLMFCCTHRYLLDTIYCQELFKQS